MNITLRKASPEDAEECAAMSYRAFGSIAKAHNFPSEWATVDAARLRLGSFLRNPRFYGVVAESGGRIVGANFLEEQSTIGSIGPVSVEPEFQGQSIGRRMMEHLIERVERSRLAGVRLVQTAYNNHSLSLYAKLGFEIRETLSALNGKPPGSKFAGHPARKAVEGDLERCNRLCFAVHGHDRGEELREAIAAGTAMVVEHLDRISGYATFIGFGGHAVAESNDDLKAMIAAALGYPGLGFLLPSRNGEALRWCYDNGLKLVQQMTLMTVGLYNEPAGRFICSIRY